MTDAGEREDALARFVHRVGRLKSVARAGWLHRGVPAERTESVADHSFRVAMLAWMASDGAEALDRNRVIRLALLHDLAESITGDLTPYDPESLVDLDPGERREALNRRQVIPAQRKELKRAAEAAAIADLVADLPPALHEEIVSLWQELEERSTLEARFVKQIDILETYLQSREYLAADPGLPVESFAAEVQEAIEHPDLQRLRDAIARLAVETGSPG